MFVINNYVNKSNIFDELILLSNFFFMILKGRPIMSITVVWDIITV